MASTEERERERERARERESESESEREGEGERERERERERRPLRAGARRSPSPVYESVGRFAYTGIHTYIGERE